MRRDGIIAASLLSVCVGCGTDGAQPSTDDELASDVLTAIEVSKHRHAPIHHPRPPRRPPHHRPADCEEAPPPISSCGWSSYAEGLSTAAMLQVLGAPGGMTYAIGGNQLFTSEDRGESWSVRGTLSKGAFRRLVLDPADRQHLIAATTTGVFESPDGGRTWSPLSLDGLSITAADIAASQVLRVYAASNGAGVFRSDDGGATWAGPGEGIPYASPLELSVDPAAPDTVVAALALLNDQGGYATGALARTENGGLNWEVVLESPQWIPFVARCPADPTKLYTGVDTQLARSYDGGATWEVLPVDGTLFIEDIAVDSDDCENFYVTQYTGGLRHTTDGGHTFGPLLKSGLDLVPIGAHPGNVIVDRDDPSHLVMASHGGIHLSDDAGASWRRAKGLLNASIGSLSSSPLDPSRLWLASWGGGVWTRPSSARAWERVEVSALPLDYTQLVAADPYVRERVAAAGNPLYLSVDGFDSSTKVGVGGNPTAIAFDPDDADSLYVATQVSGLYHSTDGGHNWAALNGNLEPWPTANGTFIDVRQVVINPQDSNVLYIGTLGRGVYRSEDAGASWQSIFAPTKAIGCLALVEGNPSVLYACAQGVFASEDGGASWNDVGTGLPSLDVLQILPDETTGNLYASTSKGVYVLKSGGVRWEPLDTDCLASSGPLAIVQDGGRKLLVVGSQGSVYARPL